MNQVKHEFSADSFISVHVRHVFDVGLAQHMFVWRRGNHHHPQVPFLHALADGVQCRQLRILGASRPEELRHLLVVVVAEIQIVRLVLVLRLQIVVVLGEPVVLRVEIEVVRGEPFVLRGVLVVVVPGEPLVLRVQVVAVRVVLLVGSLLAVGGAEYGFGALFVGVEADVCADANAGRGHFDVGLVRVFLTRAGR